MTDEAPPHDGGNWLLDPPAAGAIHLHVAVGEEVELSPAAREALETVLALMHDDEVMGFLPPCGGLAKCTDYNCTLGKCTPLISEPCRANQSCRIAEFWSAQSL